MINENPKIYVGTYKKYNDGSLFGAWADLTKFKSKKEFLEYCYELHSDEKDPELMFQDFECFPDQFYSESYIHDDLWDWMELDKKQIEIIDAFTYLFCTNFNETMENCEDAYMGHYNSFREFSEQTFFDLNDVPESLKHYICIDKVERDYRIDYSQHNGHVFYKNY